MIKNAMILCAGRGERFKPITDTCPKPLINVGGHPLLYYHLQKLKKAGIEKIVLNTYHLGSMIEDYVHEYLQAEVKSKGYSLQIHVSKEAELLDTGGGIFNALSHFGKSYFMLMNADIYSELDYATLLNTQLDEEKEQGHFILVPTPSYSTKSDFSISTENGQSFLSSLNPCYTYAGMSIIHPNLFQGCRLEKFSLVPLILRAIEQKKATAQLYCGQWHDVGTQERWLALDANLKVN